MKKVPYIILYIFAAALAASCRGHENGRVPQPSDTLYTVERAEKVFFQDPERALIILDSAEIVGNTNHTKATLQRARIFSHNESTMDSARTLCKQLLAKGELSPEEEADVLEVLVNVARIYKDDEGVLKYGMQYIEVCRQLGEPTSALATQSEIGEALIRLGRPDEGFAKMDDAIAQLDKTRKFNEMDACVRAMKRKISILCDLDRYAEVIPVADSIVEKLNDYSEHPADYDDGSSRMPTEERRPGYIDWYSGQAYAFMAYAYSMLNDEFRISNGEVDSTRSSTSVQNSEFKIQNSRREALRCLALFNQTNYSQTINGKKMISSTWCELGMYDKMLAFYDELESLWGTDTMHYDYAVMLSNRAIAARHQGRLMQSINYMQRHQELVRKLNDAKRLATAQEYAARYHEQEHQLALEQEQAAKHRLAMIILFLGILTLMAIVYTIIIFRQLLSIRKKNAVLSKEISGRISYEEKYISLAGSSQRVADSDDHQPADSQPPANFEELSDRKLFDYIRKIVLGEKLHLDPQFGREQLVERLQLPKERIGAALAQGSEYGNLANFLNDARLFHSAKLLTEQPEMTISEVATASGFASRVVFSRNFKERFAMTPTEFREKKL